MSPPIQSLNVLLSYRDQLIRHLPRLSQAAPGKGNFKLCFGIAQHYLQHQNLDDLAWNQAKFEMTADLDDVVT